jgi:hypothetical protein
MDDSLWRDTRISSAQQRDLWRIKWAFSTLQAMTCKKCPFQKLPQLSQGNNVLDEHASHTDFSLWTPSCFSPPYLKKPIWNKERLSPGSNP